MQAGETDLTTSLRLGIYCWQLKKVLQMGVLAWFHLLNGLRDELRGQLGVL